MSSRHLGLLGAVAALVCASAAACGDAASPATTAAPGDQYAAAQVEWAGDPDLASLIASIRAATAHYHDVDVAFAAGYGTRRLVGIEYVVYRAAWDAVNDDPPTLLGVPFDEKFGSEAHGHADHYELHLWLWRHNSRGMFAPWNPKVSCQG